MAILGPRRPDDETARHAQAAIDQARQALNDPDFVARMQPNDRALFEERLRNAEQTLAEYRRADAGGASAMAMGTATTGNPAAAVVGMALLAMGFALTSQATNRAAAAQALTGALGLLSGLHQQIIRRSLPPSPAGPSAAAGAGATILLMAAVIGSIQGLRDVENQIERDIRENSQRAAGCSALIAALRAAIALLKRGLANPTATPQRAIRERIDAVVAAIAALYQCMGLPVPSFTPRR